MKHLFTAAVAVGFIIALCFAQEPAAMVNKTVLLLHCDGQEGSKTFADSSKNSHAVSANGDAQVSTAQKKFGTGSLALDGDADYLALENSADWDFGTGDFTVDFWVRFNDISPEIFIFDVGGSQAGSLKGIGLYYSANEWWVAINDAYPLRVAKAAASVNTWYHVAIVRSKGTLYLFKDGIAIGRAQDASDISGFTDGLTIGSWSGRNRYFVHGWIDEFRVSKGLARWTGNFNPPAAAYDID